MKPRNLTEVDSCGELFARLTNYLAEMRWGWVFPRGIYSEIHSPIATPEIMCVMALTLQPVRGCSQHSVETGTRLLSAIQRRLFSRFFFWGRGDVCTQAIVHLLNNKFFFSNDQHLVVVFTAGLSPRTIAIHSLYYWHISQIIITFEGDLLL